MAGRVPPTEEKQARERTRLHEIIAEMVPWEATNNPQILNKARYEIAHSLARAQAEAAYYRQREHTALAA